MMELTSQAENELKTARSRGLICEDIAVLYDFGYEVDGTNTALLDNEYRKDQECDQSTY